MEYYTNQEFSNFGIPTTNGCSIESSSSYAPFGDELSPPDFALDSSTLYIDPQTLPYYSILDDNEYPFPNGLQNLDNGAPSKPEPASEIPGFEMGSVQIRKSKVKKLNGQPSKNLMAERRRRKRLNDRLTLLRSVVPKISKMDRTSILGDTIDYMKELLDRINILQKEMHLGPNQLSTMNIFKDVEPNEILPRNSPKFEVERRNPYTKIEICCGAKPELLLSTAATLEALGLEVQHCVISCFNGFALQASCSEDLKKMATLESEDIKQALLRNAGYGGKCL
ncbi:beta HLH protein 93 [Perilla frutescens var. frutescens]|nr:beta HLH protein 93 [Perilla frutescens var. frutescens]